MSDENAIITTNHETAEIFLPALTLEDVRARYNALVAFVKSQMHAGKDFGTIPGAGQKPTLLKPGAEKLITFFGYQVRFVEADTVEQWDESDPLFHYRRVAQLWRGNALVAEASGSCNSRESRYRWRWVKEQDLTPAQKANMDMWVKRGGRISEFAFAIEKGKTEGQWSRPQEYWDRWRAAIKSGEAVSIQKPKRNGEMTDAWEMDAYEYRVPNEDIYSLANTILKMAEKRALVAVVLIGCNASEFFTQDLDDLHGIEPSRDDVIDAQSREQTFGADDPENIMANMRAAIEGGTFTPQNYLDLGEALGYENSAVMEILSQHKRNFSGAALELMKRYRDLNGDGVTV